MPARASAADREKLLAEVAQLPDTWHSAGTLQAAALQALARHAANTTIEHSIETGTGRSTLLLSHLSPDHKVFTIGGDGDTSYAAVRGSSLLHRDTVEFVIGPTQSTLPAHHFAHKLQFAMLDGPHGYPFPDLEYLHVYPHLDRGALLVIDDIHIPTVYHLFAFLREDEMFQLIEVADTTAFFRRTASPSFPPDQDNWWLQAYNARRFPVSEWPRWGGFRRRAVAAVPLPVRRGLKRVVPARLRRWLRG